MITNSAPQEVPGRTRQAIRTTAATTPRTTALPTADGSVAGSLDRGSARRRLERTVATLSAANAALRAANAELAGFAAVAAHDLRSPLRAIDGFSRLLLDGYGDALDAEGRRLLAAVRDGSLKMSRLIDDILALCRVGREEMTLATVDMAALVADVLAAPAMAGAGKIAVEIKPLPHARGDRRLLQHVWLNLLDNAIKFTAASRDPRIEVGAVAGAGETVYYVRDNGVGFDMRHADRLFVPFQRLHGDAFLGTGIGLAIVKRIVARHGGRVWAEGRPGVGATFFFALSA